MTKYGYMRVSTGQQKTDTQRKELTDYGCDVIIEEKMHGDEKTKRVKQEALLKKLQPGDELVITRLDRLGRTSRQLEDFWEYLEKKEVKVNILSLGMIDTKTIFGKTYLKILAAISQMERELILEKTEAGRRLAMQKGVKFGPKPKFNDKQLVLAAELYESGDKTMREIVEMTGISRATIYRYVKEKEGAK